MGNNHYLFWEDSTVYGISCEPVLVWEKSKEESKDQESIQSSTTHDPDTLWECDKSTRKRHIHKRLEVSPFPAGDHKAQDTDNAICQIQTQIKKKSTKEATGVPTCTQKGMCLQLGATGTFINGRMRVLLWLNLTLYRYQNWAISKNQAFILHMNRTEQSLYS